MPYLAHPSLLQKPVRAVPVAAFVVCLCEFGVWRFARALAYPERGCWQRKAATLKPAPAREGFSKEGGKFIRYR